MSEVEGLRPPSSAVFTTLPWDNARRVRAPHLHMARLRKHAEALGLSWPVDLATQLSRALDILSPQGAKGEECNEHGQPPGLLKVELDEGGGVSLEGISTRQTSADVSAVSVTAPRFPLAVQGLKHAAWSSYHSAGEKARQTGAQIALLVHEGAVIDGDRASPMLLDADGVAWISDPTLGGVASTTLELVVPALEKVGIPIVSGRLTENMLERAREVVMLGSGLAAVRITDIDEQMIGTGNAGPTVLRGLCSEAILAEGWTSFEDWMKLLGGKR